MKKLAMKTIIRKFLFLSFLVLCSMFLFSLESNAQQSGNQVSPMNFKSWSIKIIRTEGIGGTYNITLSNKTHRLTVLAPYMNKFSHTLVVPKDTLEKIESLLREQNSGTSEEENKESTNRRCNDCPVTTYTIKVDNSLFTLSTTLQGCLWEILNEFYYKAISYIDEKWGKHIQKLKRGR